MFSLFSESHSDIRTSKGKFKDFPFEKRLAESKRIMEKFPERIPIIVERGNTNIQDIDKNKYLVPKDLTVGQFMYVIRKRIKLKSDEAFYIFINNTIPATAQLLSIEYNSKKDEDGFLYVTYAGESTFG